MYFMANTLFWQRDSGPRVLERAVWKGLILSDAMFSLFARPSSCRDVTKIVVALITNIIVGI